MNKKIENIYSKPPIIYLADNGSIELQTDSSLETLWATQKQIAELFGVTVSTINEHISNIYKSSELASESTLRNFRIVQTEANRKVERELAHFNLDVILSVGYRVNSLKATNFRKWATNVLKQYLLKGVAINREVIAKNYQLFEQAISELKLITKDKEINHNEVAEIISSFAYTWLSLDSYDRETISIGRVTKKKVKLTSYDLLAAIAHFKLELIAKKEATELFATDKSKDSIESIVANIMQSFGGEDLYATIEEKAAHLLYFIVKNHPFVDGNKRCGAFAFVWFLSKYSKLDMLSMSPQALAAVTLLVAISNPKDKDRLVTLVASMVGFSHD
jgi:prophage maintenance system killer protein